MRTNTKPTVRARTHEGGPALIVSPAKQLRRAVMANMLFEDTFYESGVEISLRLAELVKVCPFKEAAQCAIDAREKFKLRHMPLYLAREMLFHHGGRQMGDLIARVIQRPDEMGELIALYWKGQPDAPLDRQLKLGLARAFHKFTPFQLAKYNSEEAAVRLRDVMFLTHPRPTTEQDKALFKHIAQDTLPKPDTWEVRRSEGAGAKATFTELLERKQLGAMALLRNLRTMLESNVPEELIRNALFTARVDRVLPFRFITAARHAPRLEDAIEIAMFKGLAMHPALPGKTAILIDHSASMDGQLSKKSELTCFDAAVGLAMLVRETATACRVFAFSDECVEVAPRRGFGLAEAIRSSMSAGGTRAGAAIKHVYSEMPDIDRLIVVTDEQSADRPPAPLRGRGYLINVAPYQHGIGYVPWVTIDGWSEAVLDYIREFEADDAARAQ